MGRLHARALSSLPGAQVLATCDPDHDRAGRLAAELDGPTRVRVYRTHVEMLLDAAPDAVIVATPDALHREPAVAAARAGCAVFVEKPLATTIEDARAIIDACTAANVPLTVGFILRHEPAYVQLHQAIAGEHLLGELVSLYARRNATVSEADRLGGRVDPLLYLGVHDFDQLLWNHPKPIATIQAVAIRKGVVFRRFGLPDAVWTTVRFTDGAVAVVESGWTLPASWASWESPATWPGFGDVRMDVAGTEGFASLDLRHMGTLAVTASGPWRFPDSRHWPEVFGQPAGAVQAQMLDFLAVAARRRLPRASGEDGLRALAIAVAARRSLEEGRPITAQEAGLPAPA